MADRRMTPNDHVLAMAAVALVARWGDDNTDMLVGILGNAARASTGQHPSVIRLRQIAAEAAANPADRLRRTELAQAVQGWALWRLGEAQDANRRIAS